MCEKKRKYPPYWPVVEKAVPVCSLSVDMVPVDAPFRHREISSGVVHGPHLINQHNFLDLVVCVCVCVCVYVCVCVCVRVCV